jgi:hypothetical protein
MVLSTFRTRNLLRTAVTTHCFRSQWQLQTAYKYHTSCRRLLVSVKPCRFLVCGDGNLSFSASLSESLNTTGRTTIRQYQDNKDIRLLPIHLTATVLESKMEHAEGKCLHDHHVMQ